MREYIISIMDDTKASGLLSLLTDLSYVKISEQTGNTPNTHKRFSLMDNPLFVENCKRYSREELNER